MDIMWAIRGGGSHVTCQSARGSSPLTISFLLYQNQQLLLWY